MTRSARITATTLLALVVPWAGGLTAQQVDYNRAEQLLSWNTSRLISGDQVSPNWMADDTRFWYRSKTSTGNAFVLVDPVRNTQGPLFDHYRMAASLSMANDTSYHPDKLPFSTFRFVRDETAIAVRLGKKQFQCGLASYECVAADTLPDARAFVVSPDSVWEAFAHEHNLYVRHRDGGDTVQLTFDGEEGFAYGVTKPGPSQVRNETPRRPSVRWSPDSKRLVVSRTDERNVGGMHWISYTAQRPVHYSRPYGLPGDSIIPVPSMHVIEIGAGIAATDASQDGDAVQGASNVRVEFDPQPWQLQLGSSSFDSLWSSDGSKLYVTYYTRGAKHLFLVEVDAATGAQRILAADSARTNVIGQQYTSDKSWYVTGDGQDVIWWSERDGWGHLWRLDGNGGVRHQITSGAWVAGTIHHVDDEARQIYFIGRGREPGRNPYYTHLYRVNFDGSGMLLLTPEAANHDITFVPSGDFFLDRSSRMETPPVTVLRRAADGAIVQTLETADISRLEEVGFTPAETFVVKGRDGITDIHGVIYFPPDLDTTKSYPVIDHIYPGPHRGSVGRSWGFKSGGEDFALAQLGFVVVQIDAMGSAFRSKAFHDHYYGNMGDNGLPDHIAGIKQLAARYRFIDVDRVGIYGGSGGGFASTDGILRFPEFFKVAVSSSGNHDNRTYGLHWGTVYQGLLERDSVTGGDNFEDCFESSWEMDEEDLLGTILDWDDILEIGGPEMDMEIITQGIEWYIGWYFESSNGPFDPTREEDLSRLVDFLNWHYETFDHPIQDSTDPAGQRRSITASAKRRVVARPPMSRVSVSGSPSSSNPS